MVLQQALEAIVRSLRFSWCDKLTIMGIGLAAPRRNFEVAEIRRSRSPSVDKVGRLEKEFEVLENIGIGEFGNVIKVRERGHNISPRTPSVEYALKRTQRFEGWKHRCVLYGILVLMPVAHGYQ